MFYRLLCIGSPLRLVSFLFFGTYGRSFAYINKEIKTRRNIKPFCRYYLCIFSTWLRDARSGSVQVLSTAFSVYISCGLFLLKNEMLNDRNLYILILQRRNLFLRFVIRIQAGCIYFLKFLICASQILIGTHSINVVFMAGDAALNKLVNVSCDNIDLYHDQLISVLTI